VLDGAVKTFEIDTAKPVNAFFEHNGWVTEFIPWYVLLCVPAWYYVQFQVIKIKVIIAKQVKFWLFCFASI